MEPQNPLEPQPSAQQPQQQITKPAPTELSIVLSAHQFSTKHATQIVKWVGAGQLNAEIVNEFAIIARETRDKPVTLLRLAVKNNLALPVVKELATYALDCRSTVHFIHQTAKFLFAGAGNLVPWQNAQPEQKLASASEAVNLTSLWKSVHDVHTDVSMKQILRLHSLRPELHELKEIISLIITIPLNEKELKRTYPYLTRFRDVARWLEEDPTLGVGDLTPLITGKSNTYRPPLETDVEEERKTVGTTFQELITSHPEYDTDIPCQDGDGSFAVWFDQERERENAERLARSAARRQQWKAEQQAEDGNKE